MDERFKKALKFVLKWEGGYANNPYDKGGATNKGITQRTYNAWLNAHGKQSKDVRVITNEEVEQIYYTNYWLAAGCSRMSNKFAVLAFDTAVNMGVSVIDDFMRSAEWKYPDKFLLARISKYNDYLENKTQKEFIHGWLNRIFDLQKFIEDV